MYRIEAAGALHIHKLLYETVKVLPVNVLKALQKDYYRKTVYQKTDSSHCNSILPYAGDARGSVGQKAVEQIHSF